MNYKYYDKFKLSSLENMYKVSYEMLCSFSIEKSDQGSQKQDLYLLMSSFFLSKKFSVPQTESWNVLPVWIS